MNTVYFNPSAAYHEKIRTPPADAIKDYWRVAGIILLQNKSLRREIRFSLRQAANFSVKRIENGQANR
jgi:hypothetical protein